MTDIETKGHSQVLAGSIHTPINLYYPTEADRIAGTNEINGYTLSALNLYQHALQVDTAAEYMLLQVSPCIIWSRVDTGVPNETTSNMSIYVDSSSGDDDTGNGSQTYPFETITKALSVVPYRLKHKVEIVVPAGNYTEFPRSVVHEYVEDGKLVIDGSGLTYPSIYSGVIDAVTPVGGLGPYGVGIANDLSVAGSPGWATDLYYGKWVHITSGSGIGRLMPIFSSGSDYVRIGIDFFGFVAGDSFEIVSEPIVVRVDHNVFFQGNASPYMYAYYADGYSPQDTHLYLLGMRFEVDISESTAAVTFDKVLVNCGFTSVSHVADITESGVNAIRMYNTIFNRVLYLSDVADNATLEDWPFTFCGGSDGVPPTQICESVYAASSAISSIVTRSKILMVDCNYSTCFYSMSGGLESEASEFLMVDHLYVECIGFTDNGIEARDAMLRIDSAWIQRASRAMRVRLGASIKIRWLQGTTITSNYAMWMETGGYVLVEDPANVTVTGVVGALEFIFDGSTHVAWPTSGNVATDIANTMVAAL